MAYTTWTVVEKDAPGPDGSVAIRVELTGGPEAAKRIAYNITGNTTIAALKNAVWQQANVVASKSIADTITVGLTGTVVSIAPPAPTPPTAKETWLAEGQSIAGLESLGLTGAPATALATRKSTWITSYQAGFVD